MTTPDLDFTADDAVARHQTSTAIMELLQAKDQAIASLIHQNREQERLITALCDRLAEDRTQPLPPQLLEVLARFRKH